MKLNYILILFLCSTVVRAQDDADYTKEKRFHDIYQQFNIKPTDDENWSKASSTKSQTYSINQGDTLWDISETFFGDPQFWPKIWSLNSSVIENPHEIKPQNNVSFVPGTLTEPPTLAVEEKPKEPTEPAAGANDVTVKASAEVVPPMEAAPADPAKPVVEPEGETSSLSAVEKQLELDTPLPPPIRETKPIGKIPKSLPAWSLSKNNPTSEFTIDLKSLQVNYPTARMVLPFYLVDKMPESKGFVVETEMGTRTAAEYQFITIKLPAETPKILMAIKEVESVKDPVSGNKSKVVEVLGQIELLEQVDAEENLYRAIVKSIVSPIEVGAQLVVEDWPIINMLEGKPGPAVDADVIGGQFDFDRTLYGSGSIIYLNQGSKAGLSEGQTLPVYRLQKLRNSDSKEKINRRYIGKIKVVKTSEEFATALVLNASEEIETGDKTIKTSVKK